MTGESGQASYPEPRTSDGALRRALESPRYEILPLKGALDQAAHIPPHAEVTITCSPTLGIENTLEFAEELSSWGFRVVPHVSARLVEDEAHLRRVLRRLDGSGLRHVFVVGGDAKEPVGPYGGGLDLLRAMARVGHGVERIGVPAYPEGHPFAGEEAMTRLLLQKQEFASYMVTQICFRPDTILAWLERTRAQGIALPAYVGVPGAVDRGRLLRVSLRIGVGTSLRYLRKQHGLAGRLLLHHDYTPDEILESLAPYVGSHGLLGFHVNTFNQVEATERWRLRMLAFLGREEAQA